MTFNKYPSIEQFRSVVRKVSDRARYSGRDEDEQPVFDLSKPLPKLVFTGTVKLHGTNAGVGLDFDTQEVWAQSRERKLTVTEDNSGFCLFTEVYDLEMRDVFHSLTAILTRSGCYKLDNYSGAILYGEWCGKGIQKGVAINQLERMFVVFGIKLLRYEGEPEWLPDYLVQDIVGHNEDFRTFNIFTFGGWREVIDFEHPELSQNLLVEHTEQVEKCCPVGKYFGVEGIGEGIVWKCITEPYYGSDFMFKVKGEKHSESRVKRLASMDIEKVNSLSEFTDKAVTENRLEHALSYLNEQGLGITLQNTGIFLKWLVTDVLKEETDTIEASGLSIKEASSACSKKAKAWYFTAIEHR